MTSAVHHDTTRHCFEIVLEGARAFLTYEPAGERIAITHTFVPPELRGRGLAEALMKAAVAHARAGGLTIDPVCSYAARYLEKNPLPPRDAP